MLKRFQVRIKEFSKSKAITKIHAKHRAVFSREQKIAQYTKGYYGEGGFQHKF